MKKTGKAVSKLLPLLLVVCMLLSPLGMAAGEAADCPDHTHDAQCGYVEAVAGVPCAHVHDGACGYDGQDPASCTHLHDTACGYIAAVPGAPCKHTCETCKPTQNSPGSPAQTKTITAFAQLAADIWFQDVASGAKKADLTLPDTLTATIGGQSETIQGVTWACAAYDDATGMTENEYEWKAVLPEGYAPAEGVELPSLFALVDGGGLMAPMAVPVITTPGGQQEDGYVGAWYELQIDTSVNDISSWSYSNGSHLGNGLYFYSYSSYATIGGTPSATGDFTFAVTATNADGTSAPVEFKIKILPFPTIPTVGFGGKEWIIIGDGSSGVAPKSGALTLLSKTHVFGTTIFGSDSAYNGSRLQTAMTNAANALYDPEEALILERTLTGTPGVYSIGTEMAGDAAVNQLFWPLSVGEHGALSAPYRIYSASYWLRSPGIDGDYALYGYYDGGSAYQYIVSGAFAIRPAFWLNQSFVLFTSAAKDGKLGAAGPNLSAATPPTNFYKFTMIDSANLSLTSVTPTGESGDTITFSYAGATPGKTLSAIVTDSSGTVKYYGKLLGNTAASGTGVQVTLPSDFVPGSDTLQIFVEEINDDNYTDFASTPITLLGAVSIAGLPDSYTLYTGGRVSWTPAPAGGTWSYDSDYLSMTKDGDKVTFKALKVGKTEAIYAVNGVSHTVDITINKSTIPQTGDSANMVPWILMALASLCGAGALLLYRKKRKYEDNA